MSLSLKSFKSVATTLFILSNFYSASLFAVEMRDIHPPKFGEAQLGKKIVCHRPMRRGIPKMEIERKDTKLIAHNYGHGGSGWTLGPGSVKYILDKLADDPSHPDAETPITVVGGGAIGLFTVMELLERGFTHITLIAENFDDLTSHNAGGLLAPVSMDNDPSLQPMIDQIGIDAYNFYKEIANGMHPLISGGARIVPTYFEDRENSGLEPYVGKVMQPAKDVILNFGNGTTRSMVAYDDGIFMDTGRLMGELHSYISKAQELGRVRVVQQRINQFEEISDAVIMNCTGLGSNQLNEDSELIPVQGHLMMLKDQNPEDLEYMILVYFDEGTTSTCKKIKRSFYMFPKTLPGAAPNDVGVIGGTFIEEAGPETPHLEEFDIMIDKAKWFYGLTQAL